MRIDVLHRIPQQHPEISRSDVLTAFHNIFLDAPRQGESDVWIAVGTDGRLREIEMVYIIDHAHDRIVIHHAFTPPTRKFRKEIGNARRRTS